MLGRRFVPLRVKLIGALMPLIVLPFGVAGSAMYAQHLAVLEQTAETSTHQIVNQVSSTLERLIQEAERLTLAPVSDSEIVRLLQDHGSPSVPRILSFAEEATASGFLTSAIFDSRSFSGYGLFTEDGHLLAPSMSVLVPETRWSEPANRDWMKKAYAADGALIFVPTHDADYYVGAPEPVLSFARLLRDRVTHTPIGYAKIDLTPAALSEYLSSPTIGDLGRLVVTTADGTRVYPDAGASTQHAGIRTLASSTLPLGLEVRADVSSAVLQRESGGVVAFAVTIGLLCLVLAAALAAYVIHRLMKPIQALNDVMREVGLGQLQLRAEIHTRDEVGDLTETFNGMMDEIDQLVGQVYRAQISERDALISALQAQMNPHFLYNSLEAVNMLAVSEGQWGISDAVVGLGQQLRYLTHVKHTLVTLREELAFAESWLRLQALRLTREVNVDDRIDPAFDSVQVPRVSLQPIFENALKHGESSTTLTLRLQAHLRDGAIHIRITDNGGGLTEANLADLRGSLADKTVSRRSLPRGFGLPNLAERLVLHFGPSAALRLDHADQGIAVTLIIPLDADTEDTDTRDIEVQT